MQSPQKDASRSSLVWGFFMCLYPSLLPAHQRQAPRLAGVGSKSQEKNLLSTIVVLSRAANEGSLSAMQLNMHNGLAKTFHPLL